MLLSGACTLIHHCHIEHLQSVIQPCICKETQVWDWPLLMQWANSTYQIYEVLFLTSFSVVLIIFPLLEAIEQQMLTLKYCLITFRSGQNSNCKTMCIMLHTIFSQLVNASPPLGSWTFGHSDVVLVNTDSSHVWPSSSLKGIVVYCAYQEIVLILCQDTR